MPLLTTTQIAARLGISERTAYRWIERKWLRATKEARGHRYNVDEADLDALARNEPDELTAIHEKYEALEKRIATLESEVAELRAARSTRHTHEPKNPTLGNLPSSPSAPGEVAARSFAQHHGLTKERIAGMINRNEIETTPRAIGHVGKKQHMLTPAQQRQAIQFWQDSGIAYTACPACPHETV